MPLPPAVEETEENDSQDPKFQFSYVECLMYLFHQLGRKYPEFLTDEANAEKLKDFRIRYGLNLRLFLRKGFGVYSDYHLLLIRNRVNSGNFFSFYLAVKKKLL